MIGVESKATNSATHSSVTATLLPTVPATASSPQVPKRRSAAMAARVQKEIKKLAKSPPPGISAWPSSENTMSQLQVQMQGPSGTPYEQGLFRLEVCLPQRYPFEPPKVQFLTPVYHPNIDAQGRICLDVLNMPPKGSWGPALDLCKVLIAVRQLLGEPNPKDPLVVDVAEEYASQPELFKVKARQHVARHARPTAAANTKQPIQQAEGAPAGLLPESTDAAGSSASAAAAVNEAPPVQAGLPAPGSQLAASTGLTADSTTHTAQT